MIPATWPGFEVHYRFRNTVHHIHVIRRPGDSRNVIQVTLDARVLQERRIPLQDDEHEHWIEVVVGDA